MPVNVVSKHLPRVARHLRTSQGENLLELAYKVEAIRLFATRIDQFAKGEISPPANFDSGIDAPNETIAGVWQLLYAPISARRYVTRLDAYAYAEAMPTQPMTKL